MSPKIVILDDSQSGQLIEVKELMLEDSYQTERLLLYEGLLFASPLFGEIRIFDVSVAPQ